MLKTIDRKSLNTMTIAQLHTKIKEPEYIGSLNKETIEKLLSQSTSSLIEETRKHAYQTYASLPAPSVFDEAWRRTDPEGFPFSTLSPLPMLNEASAGAAGSWDEHFDVVVTIDDNGFCINDLTHQIGEDRLRVSSLAQAAEEDPALLRKYLQEQTRIAQTGKFENLTDAFWNVGICVHVAKGVKLEKGILIKYNFQKPDSMLIPKLLVIAEAQSEAAIVEHLSSVDGVPFMAIGNKEVYVHEAARLAFLSLQEWGDQSYYISSDMARVDRDAQVDWITLNFGSKLCKLMLGSDVAGEGAKAELDGLFYAFGEQHIDQTTLQVHSAPNTYSRLLYKGAVRDASHSVYQGIINAKEGAIKVDAYQTNNNLILNDGAHADTIPGLLIDADDLKCSHGATIGNLDQDQLFYLRSRGLSEGDARKVVINGFYEEVVSRLPKSIIQDRVHQLIAERTDFDLKA